MKERLTEQQRARFHPGQILLARPDNVTPATRTPWGGERIFRELKAGLPGIPATRAQPIVGESWEISDDPAFPSRVYLDPYRLTELSLSALLRDFAPDILGETTARATGPHLPVLVKIIDAADDLSVQVHPPLGHPVLAPGESGKDEAWVVLDHAPGAGLYLGFREGVTPEALLRAVSAGADLSPMLRFVPVAPGDVFAVPAGTVHAIGRGLLLLEIQRFSPPASGVTYRLWDWNRRYDSQGRRDPQGTGRRLHVAQSLEVLDFAARPTPLARQPLHEAPGALHERLVADLTGLRLDRLRLEAGAALPLATEGRFLALTCTRGRARATTPGALPVELRRGESALVPASAPDLQIEALPEAEIYAVTAR